MGRQERQRNSGGLVVTIDGVITNIETVDFAIDEDGGPLTRTHLEYKCEGLPFKGFFDFQGDVHEGIIGREFDFEGMYGKKEVPITQRLRVYGNNYRRVYRFVDKRQRKKEINS